MSDAQELFAGIDRRGAKEGDDRNAKRARWRGTKIYRHVLAARGNVFLSLLPSARVARSVESEIKRLFKCITSPRCRSKKRKKERKKETKEAKEMERWGRASERSPDKRNEHARSTQVGRAEGWKRRIRGDRGGKDGTWKEEDVGSGGFASVAWDSRIISWQTINYWHYVLECLLAPATYQPIYRFVVGPERSFVRLSGHTRARKIGLCAQGVR